MRLKRKIYCTWTQEELQFCLLITRVRSLANTRKKLEVQRLKKCLQLQEMKNSQMRPCEVEVIILEVFHLWCCTNSLTRSRWSPPPPVSPSRRLHRRFYTRKSAFMNEPELSWEMYNTFYLNSLKRHIYSLWYGSSWKSVYYCYYTHATNSSSYFQDGFFTQNDGNRWNNGIIYNGLNSLQNWISMNQE